MESVSTYKRMDMNEYKIASEFLHFIFNLVEIRRKTSREARNTLYASVCFVVQL